MRLSRLDLTLGILAILLPIAIAVPQEKQGVELSIDRSGLPARVEDFEGATGGVFQDGRVYIAGQPDEDALRRFRNLGVTAVVNLRTPDEMDNRDRVPFDEAALVRDLGMEYVHIPLGGDDYPYTPEAVADFAAVLVKHKGPVLLHCTVAWRASYMWAAYLILYQDYSFDSALDRGEAIAISPPPLQGLLGRPLKLTYDE
jgi:uncharacterized protein (TIGR01244 family)